MQIVGLQTKCYKSFQQYHRYYIVKTQSGSKDSYYFRHPLLRVH